MNIISKLIIEITNMHNVLLVVSVSDKIHPLILSEEINSYSLKEHHDKV